MKHINDRGAGQASHPPTQPDSDIASHPSNPILAEKRQRRRAVQIDIYRGDQARITIIDVRVGRWWFSLLWKLAFDIGRESGGNIIPVFPGKADE